jgi:hypothetical protein
MADDAAALLSPFAAVTVFRRAPSRRTALRHPGLVRSLVLDITQAFSSVFFAPR